MQNATDAVFNKMRVAIKKTDHVTRGPWTPGKYDVVCSAHNGGGGGRIKIVYFPLCPNFKVDLNTPQP